MATARRRRSSAARAGEVALYSHYTDPVVAFVRAGTLDEPASVSPNVHIFTRSKLPWVVLPEGVPSFETYYDIDALWPAESVDRVRALRG